MHLNNNFRLREIHGYYFLIPIKKNSLSNEAIVLNFTAGILFKHCNEFNDKKDLMKKIYAYFNELSIKDKDLLDKYFDEMIRKGYIIKD